LPGSNDAKKLAKTLEQKSLNFKYSTLEKATESFNDNNKLGHGGFGTVYRVFLLPEKTYSLTILHIIQFLTILLLQGVLLDGREIAIKRLYFNNRHRAADFYNEVNIISGVEHKNLVRLLGCSCSGPESLLVYEYMHNRSLDRFIFGNFLNPCIRQLIHTCLSYYI
jgi:serine/threonine protein kinase